ncbi:ABC-three component system protein [Flavobacterium columnare]|uniref:ABC-three component system protein n=1 Tax=Flavobacterium columnare TaxID=996 RepID=UPI0040338B0B
MDEFKINNEHTAGPQLIGFDYQFYYFMYLILDLNSGEKIGFEVLDDIHIELANGSVELLQTKHTVQKTSKGEIVNLTERDSDLWKTISNWILFLNNSADKDEYLNKTVFKLVTNKSINNNTFFDNIIKFQRKQIKIKEFSDYIKNLHSNTDSVDIKSQIESLKKLDNKIKSKFIDQIQIISEPENIINLIKKRIYKFIRKEERVDDVYNSLLSNMQHDKYLTIIERKKFEISCEDFSRRYGNCFDFAYEKTVLPKRELNLIYPKDLKSQTFIKQLVDIGETFESDSDDILRYTTAMLKTFNSLNDWKENGDILSTQIIAFDDEAIFIWNRIFKERYRDYKSKIESGEISHDETLIKQIAIECISEVRKEKLKLKNDELNEELSNGQFYILSNEPKIGWHIDWEKKYKK